MIRRYLRAANILRFAACSSVDPSRAAKVLGWKPSVHLEEGLRRTVAWFKGDAQRKA